MANALAEIYGNSALIPIDRVISLLEQETDAKRVGDFAKRVEAVKRLDSDNEERRDYWATLAVWSTRRLGEIIVEGQESGAISTRQRNKKSVAHRAQPSVAHDAQPTVVSSLSDLGIEHTKASRAKALAAVPEENVQTYIEAEKKKGGPATIAGALRAAKPPKPKADKPKAQPAKEPEPEEDTAATDHFKASVPDELVPVFADRADFKSLMRDVSNCKTAANKLFERKSGGWLEISEITRLLSDVHRLLRFAMPYTECPKCRRKLEKKCPACKGSGWIHESMYNSAASDADKNWIEKRKSA